MENDIICYVKICSGNSFHTVCPPALTGMIWLIMIGSKQSGDSHRSNLKPLFIAENKQA
jgi:hypothetical protein